MNRPNTLEEAIRNDASKYGLEGSEYIIRVMQDKGNRIEVYIRPYNRDGVTTNGHIHDNIFDVDGDDTFTINE